MARGNMKKLYIGCSLTYAPEDFRNSVEELREQLRDKFEILDFIGLNAGTAGDVYRWDIEKCVKSADAMLAIVDYPSIGLGWELAIATNRNIPVLAAAHEESKVTRLLVGAAEEHDNLEFVRYKDINEVVGKLKNIQD